MSNIRSKQVNTRLSDKDLEIFEAVKKLIRSRVPGLAISDQDVVRTCVTFYHDYIIIIDILNEIGIFRSLEEIKTDRERIKEKLIELLNK